LRQPGGCGLDLSGIAKGHAVDVVSDLLRQAGRRHHLVEIGGECRGRGLRPDGEPWWVDVETPAPVPPLRIAAHELAVATSGDHLRGVHTIDPRTGRPATGAMAVTVVAATAMLADAWASALLVLAPDAATALATREGLAARWLDRSRNERISPALAAMLG
ncbi:FAD:protein FMN transferase, partial [Sphingomonas bacterium]|uniref:FAD:protein FMN transferase n=1 Tax=Sphingomonas bacterium TaxID=1895847 RepID=UPI001576C05E